MKQAERNQGIEEIRSAAPIELQPRRKRLDIERSAAQNREEIELTALNSALDFQNAYPNSRIRSGVT